MKRNLAKEALYNVATYDLRYSTRGLHGDTIGQSEQSHPTENRALTLIKKIEEQAKERQT
jgi:hypothetical protein